MKPPFVRAALQIIRCFTGAFAHAGFLDTPLPQLVMDKRDFAFAARKVLGRAFGTIQE